MGGRGLYPRLFSDRPRASQWRLKRFDGAQECRWDSSQQAPNIRAGFSLEIYANPLTNDYAFHWRASLFLLARRTPSRCDRLSHSTPTYKSMQRFEITTKVHGGFYLTSFRPFCDARASQAPHAAFSAGYRPRADARLAGVIETPTAMAPVTALTAVFSPNIVFASHTTVRRLLPIAWSRFLHRRVLSARSTWDTATSLTFIIRALSDSKILFVVGHMIAARFQCFVTARREPCRRAAREHPVPKPLTQKPTFLF